MMLANLRDKKAFTLVELLVVIAIVGILASIALSYYRSQGIVRARLTEVTNSMGIVASSVQAYYQDTNVWPSAGSAALIKGSLGVSVPAGANQRITAIVVNNGVITATVANIDAKVDGRAIALAPRTDSTTGAVIWSWSGSIPSAYIPKK